MIMFFIPLLGSELDLSLNQISLLIGFMYLPYVFSFVFAEIADRYERILIASVGLTLSAFMLFFLYFTTESSLVAILSSLVALSLALINPAAEGMLTALTPVEKRGEITGVQFLFQRTGQLFGPLIFGFIANAKGLNFVFLIIAILAVLLTMFSIYLKFKLHLEQEIHTVNKIEKHKEHHRFFELLRYPLKH